MIIKIFKIKLSLRRNKLDFVESKGLTLIELLIGISVFVIVLTAITGIFISGIKIQKKFLAQQELLNEATKVAELLSRNIRTATKDTDGGCISANSNYQAIYDGGDSTKGRLKFKKTSSDFTSLCQEIFIETGRIKVNYGGSYPTDYLTPSDFTINWLKFQVSGDQVNDNIQPRVSLSFEMKDKTGEKVKMSSTVSQRSLDVNL